MLALKIRKYNPMLNCRNLKNTELSAIGYCVLPFPNLKLSRHLILF